MGEGLYGSNVNIKISEKHKKEWLICLFASMVKFTLCVAIVDIVGFLSIDNKKYININYCLIREGLVS